MGKFLEIITSFLDSRGLTPSYLLVVLIVFIVFIIIGRVDKRKKRNITASVDLSSGQKALINKGVSSFIPYGMPCSILESGLSIKKVKRLLISDWNIKNREDIKDTMDTLLNEHCIELFNEYTEVRETTDKELCDDEFIAVSRRKGVNEETVSILKDFVKFVKSFEDRLREDGLLTNDYIHTVDSYNFQRVISLSRLGFDMGYISKDEALKYIELAGEKIDSMYKSELESHLGYIMGELIWGGDVEKSYSTQVKVIRKLKIM